MDILTEITKLKSDGMYLQEIKNKTFDLNYTAVSQNGLAIQFIENPCVRIIKKALEQNSNSFDYIKNKSMFTILYAVYLDFNLFHKLTLNEQNTVVECITFKKDVEEISNYIYSVIKDNYSKIV